MINYLGKGLVLVAVAVSGLFLAWAVAIFTQAIDWGFKDPRKDLGERIPSEIDTRIAALTQAQGFRARAQAGARSAATALAAAQQDYPRNVLVARDQLAELRSGSGKITVKELKYDGGVLARADKRATAGPVFDAVVPGAEKSVTGYFADLKKVENELDAVTAEVKALTEKEKALTVTLNGQKDEDGKVVKVGMYDLLEREKKTQDQVKEETEYLQPQWVRELYDAQLLLTRQARLDQRLGELKRGADAPGP